MDEVEPLGRRRGVQGNGPGPESSLVQRQYAFISLSGNAAGRKRLVTEIMKTAESRAESLQSTDVKADSVMKRLGNALAKKNRLEKHRLRAWRVATTTARHYLVTWELAPKTSVFLNTTLSQLLALGHIWNGWGRDLGPWHALG